MQEGKDQLTGPLLRPIYSRRVCGRDRPDPEYRSINKIRSSINFTGSTVPTSKTKGGTDLAIAKQIVEMHGGRKARRSEPHPCRRFAPNIQPGLLTYTSIMPLRSSNSASRLPDPNQEFGTSRAIFRNAS